MSKQDYIQKLTSYAGDGFVQFPAGARSDLESNGVTIAEFHTWVDMMKASLEALIAANKLLLLGEGILGSITNSLENIRTNVSNLDGVTPDQQSFFNNAVAEGEQFLYQIAPYLNLVDSVNYKNLSNRLDKSLVEASEAIKARKKNLDNLTKNTKTIQAKSDNILKKVSSGVLSQNFGNLSNNWWNWILMIGSALLALYGFLALLRISNELLDIVIYALEEGVVDYRILLVKWLLSTPYLILLSISLLELRSRIKLRDIYLFRKSVAGALDGYTENLLNKVEDIKDPKEKSVARRTVIEFMISSMLELTKLPSVKMEKQRIGLKVKDVAEADVTTN